MRLRLGLAAVLGLCLLCVPAAHASTPQPPQNRGLVVTPTRGYESVDPGGRASEKITVANLSDQPMSIMFTIKQFSVADFTYNYKFSDTLKDSWITMSTPQVALEPGKSKSVDYALTPPTTVSPGGHYFTIFATATIGDGQMKSQVRAASVLYVTVNGDLKISSTIQNTTIPFLSFGDVPFTLQTKNTGNTHFFAYVSGELQGISAKGKGPEVTNLLMPQTIRNLSSSMQAPLLPGLYTATYGYKTDSGQVMQRTSHVLYLPPWFLLSLLGSVWLGVILTRRKRVPRGYSVKGSSQQLYK